MIDASAFYLAAETEPRLSRQKSASTLKLILPVSVCLILAAGLVISGNASMVRLGLPLVATLLALVLYLNQPVLYLSFTLWVWFLSPLVRRLIDLRHGFADPNLILTAPLLVSSIAAWTLVRTARSGNLRCALPFLLCIVAILYGFAVGLIQHPGAEIAYGLMTWLCPLLLGMHVALDSERHAQYWAATRRTFLWAMLLLGIYGIYQFTSPPPWDAYWLDVENDLLAISSFGHSAPFQIRVWSTLNAPGPFANFAAVGMLVLLETKSRWKLPAMLAGFVSLLLSVVRTAWLSLVIGVVILLSSAKPKVIVRVMFSALLLIVCAIPLLRDPRVAFLVSDRAKTFQDIGHDGSYQERSEMYRVVTAELATNPFGRGVSNGIMVGRYVIDSGFLAALLSLGWFGSLMFAAGVFTLFSSSRQKGGADDGSRGVATAVCISMLAQLFGGNVFVSVSGMLFWLFAGLRISGSADSILPQAATQQAEEVRYDEAA